MGRRTDPTNREPWDGGVQLLGILIGLALVCGVETGCGQKPAGQPGSKAEHLSPKQSSPSGTLEDEGSSPLARNPLKLADIGWEKVSLAIVQTELSPAILIRSTGSYLGLFQGMSATNREGPTHVALSSRAGPRSHSRGKAIDVVDMEECWVVVWFAGADGWAPWDSPCALFLQHRPLAMKLDQNGLHLQFREAAGEVVVMPLYGSEKLPQQGKARKGDRKSDKTPPTTETWSEALPRDMLMRVRYWAGVSRLFPIGFHKQVEVDSARNEKVIRNRFDWHRIEDDWGTRVLKLAPISPILASLMQDSTRPLPVRFPKPVAQLDYMTRHGPYLGLEGVDAYEAVLPRFREELQPGSWPDSFLTNIQAVVMSERFTWGPNLSLAVAIEMDSRNSGVTPASFWPRLVWHSGTRTPNSDDGPLGQIVSLRDRRLGSTREESLNPSTRVFLWASVSE